MKPDISLLKKVLSLPTAPFHEEFVSDFILSFCKRLGLPIQKDLYGNLKVLYKRGKAQPIVFSAHMDHPGFEVIRGGKKTRVQLLGGIPDRFFKKAKVVLWQNGRRTKGKVMKAFNHKKRQYLLVTQHPVFKKDYGTFDLPSVRFNKHLVFTKAADDVANVAILLNLLQILVRKKAKAHVICLFTRAEEVGFIGCLGVVRDKFISKRFPVIVLEASSAKVGKVQIGGGPVLRVGDKASIFSREMDLWLQLSASKLLKKNKQFQFQRALLSGGRCEATVFTAKGYLAGCLALPLGNYHNVGPKSYAMEYISLQDYENLLRWLVTLASDGSFNQVSQRMLEGIDQTFEKYKNRLKNIAR